MKRNDLDTLEKLLWQSSREGLRAKEARPVEGNSPLAQMMRARALNDRDLAAFSGCTVNQIYWLRKGGKHWLGVKLDTVFRVSVFLKVTPAALVPPLLAVHKNDGTLTKNSKRMRPALTRDRAGLVKASYARGEEEGLEGS